MDTSSLFAVLAFVLLGVIGCGGRPADPAAPVIAPVPSVVFIGDSITYNWNQPWAGSTFISHFNWIDKGVVGDDSGQMVDRFQSDVIEVHPNVVTILAGTNDVYSGWSLCDGTGVGYDSHNFDTCHNIDYMRAQAQFNGIKVVLATIPPWNCADQSVCSLATKADNSTERYQRITALNTWIKAYAQQQDLPVADYWTALVSSDQQTYVTRLTVDGVHPNPAGYQVMEPLVEAAIQQATSPVMKATDPPNVLLDHAGYPIKVKKSEVRLLITTIWASGT